MRIAERLRKAPGNEAGFTLLETLIAMAIMVVAFTSVLLTQSSSINATDKAKRMTVVGMLAKNKMTETELLIEGKPFNEVKKEESGEFKEPYQDFRWKRVIKEIEFPNISLPSGGGEEGQTGVDQNTEMLTRLITNYLSKAVREVTITISWRRGSGEQSFSLSTYWVDLNHEFSLSQ